MGETVAVPGQATQETVYAYDRGQITLQFDKTGTGQLSASDLSHRYLWNSQAVDQLFADEQTTSGLNEAGNVVWALTDRENSVRDLATYSNGTTKVQNHRIYDAFGNLTPDANATADCIFGYTGRMFDSNTGLQNNVNRWYDPTVGRWMSEDPVQIFPNLYEYCNNDSLIYTDPRGNAAAAAPAPGSLGSLAGALAGTTKCPNCQAEAANIAAAINNTFNSNNPWYFPHLSDQRNRGYYCYEWAYAFADAANHESSGNCFTVKVQAAADDQGNVHFWVAITSKETGKTIYVDDGFVGDTGYVHTGPPIPPGYQPGNPGDVPRSNCCPPPAYDCNNKKVE